MRAGLIVGGAVIVGVAALAGCSSSSKSTTAKAVRASSTGSAVTIEAQDFKFSPTSLTAAAGKATTVTLHNGTSTKHNFTIKELGVDKDLDPGSTVTVTFTPKSAGSLTYYCEYHKAIGMTGTLHVGA